MFSSTSGKSESSYALEDTLYFYDRDEPWTFGFLNQILWYTETELFTIHKIGTIPEKQGQLELMDLRNNNVKNRYSVEAMHFRRRLYCESWIFACVLNLLKPTGYVMQQQV
jgi:hypothetical protein